MHILRFMGSKFCVKFQRAPLKFHTKFWTHTPQNVHFTVLFFCVWVTISLNCDVISLSGTGPWGHITACTVCGYKRQFTIATHCRLVKFMMSCLALKTGDHIPNFELWCLMVSVELVWYIQSSQLQPVLSVNDSDISFILYNQQYQLSEFSFPCTWQLWSVFARITQCWLYGLRKATLLTVDPMMAASWSSSVTMVN